MLAESPHGAACREIPVDSLDKAAALAIECADLATFPVDAPR
jgi:hypothetical protein